MDTIVAKANDWDREEGSSISVGKEYKVLNRDSYKDEEYVLIINDHGYKFWYTIGEDI